MSADPTPIGRARSRSLSTVVPPPTPITLPSVIKSTATTPPFSPSEEYKRAFHHARSNSMSSGSGGGGGGVSYSPASSTSDEEEPKTPLSTSPVLTLDLKGLNLNGGGGGAGIGKKARSEPDSSTTIHEHEDEHIQDDDLAPSSNSTFSPLFANGARWGFPQSQSQSSTSATTSIPNLPMRRASLGPTSPPDMTLGMMSPLGRVSSAGAPVSSNSGGSGGGFGIFRRMSVGGFGSRPKPPSPPSSTFNLPTASAPAPVSIPSAHQQQQQQQGDVAASAPAELRGRRASMNAGSGGKPKRKISPMGERMLRGGFEMH